MRARGETLRQIAERLGVSEGTVRNWTKATPVPKPEPPLPTEPRSLVDELGALADDLDAAEAFREALVCRRAADALRSADSAECDIPQPPADATALDNTRYLLAVNQAAYKRCVDTGLEQQAQRYSRTIATLMPVLARVEREAAGAGDAVVIPRAELDAHLESAREVLRTYAAQPLTCARCGAELRMSLALKAAGVE
jgi:transcriptional regulator with XRE-family HTH domain